MDGGRLIVVGLLIAVELLCVFWVYRGVHKTSLDPLGIMLSILLYDSCCPGGSTNSMSPFVSVQLYFPHKNQMNNIDSILQ
jgi:hypothetical protein